MRPIRNSRFNDQYRVPAPKNIKEVPAYLKEVICSFTKRLLYIYKLLWEAKKSLLIIMTFMAVIGGVLPAVGTAISAALINTLAGVITHKVTEFSSVYFLLILQGIYLVIRSVITHSETIVFRLTGEVVSNHIKLKIMNKSKEIDLGCYDLPDFYSKLENANREATHRPVEIMRSTFTVLSTIITMISFIVILTSFSWWAPIFIILLSLPTTIISFVYRRKTVDYMWFHSKDRRQMNYYSGALVDKNIVKEIRILGISNYIIDKYKQVFARYFGGIKELLLGEGFWKIATTVITTLAKCFLLVFIARGVFYGNIQIGDYTLYVGALNNIITGVATLISTSATIYEGTLFINNIITYLEQPKTIVPNISKPLTPERHIGHTIEFKNVSFCYPGTETYVLKDINIKIEPGQTVVLVGFNGAGKTTLIKLLTRLYDPTSGEILLDGKNIKSYDVEELYNIFGIIFQDFGKYAMSVSENIALGQIDKGIIEKDIELAAKQADAEKFIKALPDSYNTPLMRWFEDNGIELSIGQWQKLSIARAFYSDSDILILDEPTASLDPMAEQQIFNQFDKLRKDKTSIFVSHRLSSATIADKIIVLQNGEVVEMGNHHSLMKINGHYREMFETQAKRYKEN